MGKITGSVGAPTMTNVKDKRAGAKKSVGVGLGVSVGRARVTASTASAEVSLAGATIDVKGFKKVVRQKLKIKSTDLPDRLVHRTILPFCSLIICIETQRICPTG